MTPAVWTPEGPLDLGSTLGGLGRGPGDPSFATSADGTVWWATWTPDGPGTLMVVKHSETSGDTEVVADAWGPGAGWLLEGVPDLLGALDDRRGFDPTLHPLIRDLDHRFPGLRVPRTRRVFEAAVCAVLSQKVTGGEAFAAWRTLVRRHGTPAPLPDVAMAMPSRLTVPPSPNVWRRLAQHDLLAAGVTPDRARTVQAVSQVADALERTLDNAKADAALQSIPGVGPWTSAEIRQRAHGDADAISVGDFHLANDICWAFTGETGHRGDDALMLYLVQPWAGHRFRVQRLLEVGHVGAPRRRPRYSPPDHRRSPAG
jgi:3-methyladenine DNA glycosylase/8-oxoguanine DNA glycosylase